MKNINLKKKIKTECKSEDFYKEEDRKFFSEYKSELENKFELKNLSEFDGFISTANVFKFKKVDNFEDNLIIEYYTTENDSKSDFQDLIKMKESMDFKSDLIIDKVEQPLSQSEVNDESKENLVISEQESSDISR